MKLENILQRLYNPPYIYPINIIVDKKPSLLRSRELFYLLNFTNHTYPFNWQKNCKLFHLCEDSYNFLHISDIEENKLSEKLLCITNQEIEDYSQSEPVISISKLYDLFSNTENNLTIIVDDEDFKLADTRRLLKSLPNVSGVPHYYHKYYEAFKDIFNDYKLEFRFKSTKNIYLQEILIFHNKIEEQSQNIRDYIELFIDIYNKPYSPLWDFLTRLMLNKPLSKNLFNGEWSYVSKLDKYFRLIDLFKKSKKSRIEEFLYLIQKDLLLASKENYQSLEKRQAKISKKVKEKIKDFLNELELSKSPYKFMFNRLKQFCRVSL